MGYSEAEAIGKHINVIIPVEFRDKHIKDFCNANIEARRMGEQPYNIFGLRKNGEKFPAEATISELEEFGNW